MPTIRFNNSTGSDTTASGSAGAIVANGTNASFSGNTVTLDGSPDLSGFDADEDVLWLQTSTGRQFFDLSGADNSAKTVTTVNAPAGTASGLTWGIGGKRATFDNADSRAVFADGKIFWEIETETDQSISSVILCEAAFTVQGASGAKRTITQTANTAAFQGKGTRFRNLKIQNSNGTKTSAVAFSRGAGGYGNVVVVDCIIGDETNTLLSANNSTSSGLEISEFFNCLIQHTTSNGINSVNGAIRVYGTRITGASGDGIRLNGTDTIVLQDSIVDGNDGDGIGCEGTQSKVVYAAGSHFVNNGGDGINLDNNGGGRIAELFGCSFVSNGGYGVNVVATNLPPHLNDLNAFYSNTSGQTNGIAVGPNDITLTADPFVNAGAGDFNLNDTAGGGAVLRAANVMVSADTSLFPFRNFVSDDFGGGGGDTIIIQQAPYFF